MPRQYPLCPNLSLSLSLSLPFSCQSFSQSTHSHHATYHHRTTSPIAHNSLSLSLSPLALCDPISLTDPSTRDFDMIFVIMCNFLLTMIHFNYGDSVLGCIFRVFSPPTKYWNELFSQKYFQLKIFYYKQNVASYTTLQLALHLHIYRANSCPIPGKAIRV